MALDLSAKARDRNGNYSYLVAQWFTDMPAHCNFALSVEYSQAWEFEFFVREVRSLAIQGGPQWRWLSSFLGVVWPSWRRLGCMPKTAAPDSQGVPTRQLSAPAERLEYDVSSIRQNKSGATPYSNFPISSRTMYGPTGGIFSSTNRPLVDYMVFAYKMTVSQRQDLMSQLPTIGPQLKPHPAGKSCLTADPAVPPDPASAPPIELLGVWPMSCGGVNRKRSSVSPALIRAGGRNLSMQFLADSINGLGNVNRPVVDQTGLTGNFHFVLEFAPETAIGESNGNFQPDPGGPAFEEALKKQLGLKLDSQKGTADDIHVDHIEHPTEN